MKQKLTIHHDGNLNCFYMTANSVLSRSIDTTYLWNAAGMQVLQKRGSLHFTPYLMSPRDHLKHNFNIDTIQIETTELADFLKFVRLALFIEKTVLISVDLYYLPYTMYHNKKHSDHYIEIIGVNGEDWHILDHYYKYTGILCDSDLQIALRGWLENKLDDYLLACYFDTSCMFFTDINSFVFQTISTNNLINRGIVPSEFADKIPSDSVIGITAFQIFQEYVQEKVFKMKDDHTEIYRGIFKFSNSRYFYGRIIGLLPNNNLLRIVSRKYLEISDKARIVSNLLIKMYITNHFDKFQSSILEKLKEIELHESQLCIDISTYLDSYVENPIRD